ncbi:hypothetical protein HPB48_002608 [Haemaphysalis longicornis]|uniref:ERAP1-like C-terminal domain-containing protein n=1 Tax=Haemaphysalis longicornis TaxID=44386 RepID=A0A9J6FS75_HAELO|nr:hypothetical protein HPB48_002608 [Haemaphysalis longicornis]
MTTAANALARILPELQLTVFCTVIEDGGEEEWQSLYTRLGRVSNNAERRSIILSLGCTKDHDRLIRFALSLRPFV